MTHRLTRRFATATLFTALMAPTASHAGAQREEALAASVQAMLHRAISDTAAPEPVFASPAERDRWLNDMSARLARKMPDARERVDFLKTVHYEATRAGLDPQLVLGLIQVESNFRKYAVSSAGARGYMQVMPFWVRQIGTADQNLFHLRTSLRYGCTILRHYLDIEKGDLYRALGRYNGSLGRPEYPNLVRTAWEKNWTYTKSPLLAQSPTQTATR
ncbi:lytic transglycosylase domain-containing protein [Uliginosibacterium sp. sgz301328]|uniref:lytic transglycosylase domain-containing protein n=1 Tax=Uliginosibacterium sp. sgz301328 TaxID=3243764 RepID=UPI00359DEB10